MSQQSLAGSAANSGENGQSPNDRSHAREGHGLRPGTGSARGERGSPRRADASDGSGGSRPPKRNGPQGPQGDGRDGREGRKRRKDGNDRRSVYGFGDTIERATCTAFQHATPTTWPVQTRSGVATLRAVEVDQREAAILFCDGAHGGPHIWPDGEVVAPEDGEEGAGDPGREGGPGRQAG